MFNNVVDKSETDWGTGVAGPVLRDTATTYANYTAQNILGLPTDVKISDGAGHLYAETKYTYDDYGQPATPRI